MVSNGLWSNFSLLCPDLRLIHAVFFSVLLICSLCEHILSCPLAGESHNFIENMSSSVLKRDTAFICCPCNFFSQFSISKYFKWTKLTFCAWWQESLNKLWLSNLIFEQITLEAIENRTAQNERLLLIYHWHQKYHNCRPKRERIWNVNETVKKQMIITPTSNLVLCYRNNYSTLSI